MASTINADKGVVSGITGIVQTADNTGNLTLQANGVSVLTVTTSNAVAITGAVSASGNVTGNYVLGNGSLLTGISAGASWQSVQTANVTVASGSAYPINTTSGNIVVTLPASPSAGNYVILTDYKQTFGTNPVTLNPNGSKIYGNTSNILLNNSGESVSLVYIDSTQGWIAFGGFTTSPVGSYTISYLAVAGGGAGATVAGYTTGCGGGGGAGGMVTGSLSLLPGTAYTITIGAGGAGQTGTGFITGNNGANTSIGGSVTASGGGGGGTGNPSTGQAGGSGGGGGYATAGGSGTNGQGNPGGAGNPTGNLSAGGGGGAGASGGNGTSGQSGAGGSGSASSISGASATYAGGGGGGGSQTSPAGGGVAGAGGAGGGGAGGAFGANGTNGTSNTGGGGGSSGAYSGTTLTSGSGGSGIVIISYAGAQRGTGGTITSSGGNTIHTFTASGTYTA